MKTPEQLQAELKPFMEQAFGNKTDRERALLDEANKRLLGGMGTVDIIPGSALAMRYPWRVTQEPTGLYKYGDNHLRPEFNPLAEARAELLDAINMLGPMVNQRLMTGIDKRGRLEQGFINVAVKHIFKALEAAHAAEAIKE